MSGAEILALRTRMGLTQEEFAQRLGATVSTINRWEKGHINPSRMAVQLLHHLAAEHPAPVS